MPRFSIVIPTRQRADTLKFAIETALAQTHPDFEVVVQNNGNDPATNDVVASFASSRIVLNGSPWILIFGYMPLAAPLYYVPIKSNLRALRMTELFEAGRLLGASDFAIMWRIVLPCVKQGLIIGLVMNFTLAISDFVYANLLVGGHFPTLQIFMGVLNGGSGRKLSVLITTYFIVIFVVTAIVVWVSSRRSDA